MSFDLTTEQLADSTWVVALSGEIDLYNAPDVEQALLDVFGHGGTRVVVDLGGTTFIDSMALGVLVSAAKHLRGVGGQLALVCGHRDVQRFFEIAGLDSWFAIYDTRADAVAALGAPPA